MVYSKFYMASFLFLEMSQQLHSVTINARGIGSKKNVQENLVTTWHVGCFST